MCGGSKSPAPIPTPAPPRTLRQESPTAPTTGSTDQSTMDSQSARAAAGTKKYKAPTYKTENDLKGSSSSVPTPTGIKV